MSLWLLLLTIIPYWFFSCPHLSPQGDHGENTHLSPQGDHGIVHICPLSVTMGEWTSIPSQWPWESAHLSPHSDLWPWWIGMSRQEHSPELKGQLVWHSQEQATRNSQSKNGRQGPTPENFHTWVWNFQIWKLTHMNMNTYKHKCIQTVIRSLDVCRSNEFPISGNLYAVHHGSQAGGRDLPPYLY